MNRDHGDSLLGKSKGKKEEDSSKYPPTDLFSRAPSFAWHPIPDTPTPSSAPYVLLPRSASRSRSPASPAADSWISAPLTPSATTPLPPPTPLVPRPTRDRCHPRPPRDAVGRPLAPSLHRALRGRHAAGEGAASPHRLLGCHRLPTLRSKVPEGSGPSSHQSQPGSTQASPITVREGRCSPLRARRPPRATPPASNKLWKFHIFSCPLQGGAA